MKTLLIAGASAAALLSASAAVAKTATQTDAVSDVIVTATRAPGGISAEKTGSSITVITNADIEDRQVRAISDVLRDVPGASVSRTGGPGSFTQVRIRGTEANHTLVLIDGIEASDPFYGEFDFGTLISDDAARAEVLRGQQSALYGSDAIGGVIQYITPTGRELPGFRARIESGSFDTGEIATRYAGVTGDLDYALSGGYQTIGGFVVAPGGNRDIGGKQTALAAKLGYAVTDNLKLTAVARYTRTDADQIEEVFFPAYAVTDGYGSESDAQSFYGLLGAELSSLDGRWINSVNFQGVAADRDLYSAYVRSGGDKGSRLKGSYVSAFHFDTGAVAHTFTGAIDIEREKYQNTAPPSLFGPDLTAHTVNNYGFVGQYAVALDDRAGASASVRYDDNDHFENATTYRVDGFYRIGDVLRLRAASGSGIKNPSQTELFGYNATTFPFVGNPNLKPEKSEGWEAGFDLSLFDSRATLGATYFDSRLKDEIYTDFAAFPSTARNRTTKSPQKGVEVFASARLTDAWRIDAAYTYLDATNAGVKVIRRPPNIASINVAWRDTKGRGGAGITVRYNGKVTDTDFATFSTITLKDFTLVNLTGFVNVGDRIQVFGRVENLLDENYREVANYDTAGRAAYLGVRTQF